MSLFRKPKKIQRRVFCADDDEDADGEPEPPPPPLISQRRDKKENKSVKAPKLLSFADEEDECEEFKVKKSSQSKRLTKRREKDRKKLPQYDNDAFHKDIEFPEDNNGNHNNKEEKRSKKKMTLEGLILSGREALAAEGAGDLSDSGEEAGEGAAFHTYRAESVRAALAVAPGHIPDAALIHAARKTRQQARELGDFVPLGESERESGGRLVREGDGDDSADDDEGRIIVRGLDLPSDKPNRTAAVSDAEHSEGEGWEAQQMLTALRVPDRAGGAPSLAPCLAPPPPPAGAAPDHLRALQPPPTSAAALHEAWARRLVELETARAALQTEVQVTSRRAALAHTAHARCAARRAHLERAYRRAQALRGYVTDLVECLDEKMPALEALEARGAALARRRCAFLVERRRADVRDQAQDALGGAGARARAPDDAEKAARAAEREGRRRARRLRRSAAGGAAAHRDGDSSDDSLPGARAQRLGDERAAVRAAAAALWADALPAWRGLAPVLAVLARWRRRMPRAYEDAHAPAALPKLLAPYVRHQLILWNPLADEDNEDYEKMEWYRSLMMYGAGATAGQADSDADSDADGDADSDVDGDVDSAPLSEARVRDDVDLMLLPTILNKVVLPKLTELVEGAWDPLCVRASVRLRALLVRAACVPRARRQLRALAAAAHERLRAALQGDVFLPLLPPGSSPDGAAAAFWRRCLGSGVRLLRGTLALTAPPAPLAAHAHVMRLIETLCAGAGAAPGALCAAAVCALHDTLPRAGELRARALRRLASLAQRAADLAEPHLLYTKAMEQCRAVIAEAKAIEGAS